MGFTWDSMSPGARTTRRSTSRSAAPGRGHDFFRTRGQFVRPGIHDWPRFGRWLGGQSVPWLRLWSPLMRIGRSETAMNTNAFSLLAKGLTWLFLVFWALTADAG